MTVFSVTTDGFLSNASDAEIDKALHLCDTASPYALTGAIVVLFIVGALFSAITAYRYLGGRSTDRELITAHALYWYFLSFAFAMLWFVIYVTK